MQTSVTSFRPQQGLTIMNLEMCLFKNGFGYRSFPSPTGVNYYELLKLKSVQNVIDVLFPSPTGVNYYEYELKN